MHLPLSLVFSVPISSTCIFLPLDLVPLPLLIHTRYAFPSFTPLSVLPPGHALAVPLALWLYGFGPLLAYHMCLLSLFGLVGSGCVALLHCRLTSSAISSAHACLRKHSHWSYPSGHYLDMHLLLFALRGHVRVRHLCLVPSVSPDVTLPLTLLNFVAPLPQLPACY